MRLHITTQCPCDHGGVLTPIRVLAAEMCTCSHTRARTSVHCTNALGGAQSHHFIEEAGQGSG